MPLRARSQVGSLTRLALLGVFVLTPAWAAAQAQQQRPQQKPISDFERGRTENILAQIHADLKKDYYDPNFHGVDVDERYKSYLERLKKAPTLGDAYRVVAAYLSGLDDSHTFLIPPRRSYRVDYGYRMQMIGDKCFITDVRPGRDAAQKLHPGDQVVSLGTYSVNRKDLWQIQYFLYQIAPQPATAFVVRDPSGSERRETVVTKYDVRNRLHDDYNDISRLQMEDERHARLFRNRYEEIGDAFVWMMPVFTGDEGALYHMLDMARKHKALILDLRGNPGGLETALELMVGSVMDHDVTIGKRVMRKGEKLLVAKSRGHDVFAGQLIVLVDSRSASASELFARVVQLEHRGTVIGDLTSGSVMEAQSHGYKEGADIEIFYGASITIADLIMTDGKSLEKLGVTPDVLVLPSAADLAAGRDPVLAKAADLAGVKLDPVAAGRMFPIEWAPD